MDPDCLAAKVYPDKMLWTHHLPEDKVTIYCPETKKDGAMDFPPPNLLPKVNLSGEDK